jgi:hypothetical protein
MTGFDETFGVTKLQTDTWAKAFWKYLDDNPETGEIVRRWRKAGLDITKISGALHRYVVGYTSKLNAERKARGKRTRAILRSALRALTDLEKLYRDYEQIDAANRIANERTLIENTLSKVPNAFSTKRLGVSRSWTDLAQIEGFIFEATQQRPTPRELVALIQAGRKAAGQKADAWETNPEIIRKGLKAFKTNNPLQSSLWTNPSRPL